MNLLHNVEMTNVYIALVVLLVASLMTTSIFATSSTRTPAALLVKVPVFVTITAGLYWAAGAVLPTFGL